MKYILIQKWLGVRIMARITTNGIATHYGVDADELEAKLAEGFEIYGNKTFFFDTIKTPENDTFVALAIGKQPIKKKTREEAALEFIERIAMDCYHLPNNSDIVEKAKKILEMK